MVDETTQLETTKSVLPEFGQAMTLLPSLAHFECVFGASFEALGITLFRCLN